jgi:hypothetical protein
MTCITHKYYLITTIVYYIVFFVLVVLLIVFLILCVCFCFGVEGCEANFSVSETARAVCGNYKSPELGLNLSGS